jgi:hypothetical protein
LGETVVNWRTDTETDVEILHFCREDGSDIFLRNTWYHLQDQNSIIDFFRVVRTSKLKEIVRNANCNEGTGLTVEVPKRR